MDRQVVTGEVVLYSEQEKQLGAEATSIEKRADAIIIKTDDDFAMAGQATKDVKTAQKRVEEFWEPMRASTYAAYKAVTDHKKAMIDPLKNAETILKRKMSAYQMEKERKRREEEERIRRLAQEETNRKLEEAQKAEAEGDVFGAEYALAEAEVMDNMAQTASVAKKTAKVNGISQSKKWEIRSIDLSKLPVEFAGVVIRPADERAIMQLIKATKGKIQIPGVEYEETVGISVRAS